MVFLVFFRWVGGGMVRNVRRMDNCLVFLWFFFLFLEILCLLLLKFYVARFDCQLVYDPLYLRSRLSETIEKGKKYIQCNATVHWLAVPMYMVSWVISGLISTRRPPFIFFAFVPFL